MSTTYPKWMTADRAEQEATGNRPARYARGNPYGSGGQSADRLAADAVARAQEAARQRAADQARANAAWATRLAAAAQAAASEPAVASQSLLPPMSVPLPGYRQTTMSGLPTDSPNYREPGSFAGVTTRGYAATIGSPDRPSSYAPGAPTTSENWDPRLSSEGRDEGGGVDKSAKGQPARDSGFRTFEPADYHRLHFENPEHEDLLTREEALERGLVFFGETYNYVNGEMQVEVTSIPIEDAKWFELLPEEMYNSVWQMADAYYSGHRDEVPFSWIQKRWGRAVEIAAIRYGTRGERISPFEVYEEMLASHADFNRTQGGGGSSYGGYGGYGGFGGGGGVSSTIRLTSPSEARVILNQAMTVYMGRQATAQEINDFVKALNNQETVNPTVVSIDGTTQTQSGGFDPTGFAEDFARGTEGSADYQAATTFLDAFLDGMVNETAVI